MPPAPDITVYVPAFRTGRRLSQTLRSLAIQSYSAFRVLIGIEPVPGSEMTLEIAEDFACRDPRFEVILNSEVLGWAENHRQLQRRVDTEFLQVLPHDDALHPSCLGQLRRAMEDSPDAAIAFPWIYFVHGADGVQAPVAQRGDRHTRLQSHFAQGGNPEFWKGLTRTEAVAASGGFPAYGPSSVAAEHEWAAQLLLQGQSIPVPNAIYYKRIHRPGETSVSNSWLFDDSDEDRIQALELHDERMTRMIREAGFSADVLDQTLDAWRAAFLWRILEFGLDRYPLPQSMRKEIETRAPTLPATDARYLLCELRSRIIEGRWQEAEPDLASLATSDPGNHDAGVLWAKCLLHLDRVAEATLQLNQLETRHPNSWRHRELMSWLADHLDRHYGAAPE